MSRVLPVEGRAARAAALFFTFTLLNLSAAEPRASAPAARHAGEVTLANGVNVNGSPAVRGQTFFSGSRFVAAPESSTLLSLDNLARLGLSQEAALRLDFDGGRLGGALEAGALRVYAPRGVAADFSTADALVETDAREPVSFGLRAARGFTEVSVQSGALEVRVSGAPRRLKAGESYTTAPDPLPRRSPSGRKRAGLFVALAAAVAAVALVIAGRGEEVPGQHCEPSSIVVSGEREPFLICF